MTVTRLRHVCQVNPATPEFVRLPDDAPITFLPMEAVWPGERLDVSQRRAKSAVATGYTRFRAGDVLVPKITPTFEAARSILTPDLETKVGAGTTELHVLRAGPQMDPRYLCYVVTSTPFLKLGEAEMYGVAGQKRVPDEFIRDFVVDLPAVDEQRRIADFLDAETGRIDGLLRRRSRQIECLEERELSLLMASFSDPSSHVARRPTPWVWMPSIPGHWSIGPVHAYFSTELGKMLNPERAAGVNRAPYLRNANVHWYSISTKDMAEMSFDPSELRRYAVHAGDLLVCEGGAGVAEAAVWDGRIERCYFQKSLHRIRRIGSVPVEWLMYWLRLAKHVGQFDAEGNLATIPHLTGEQLRSLRFPVPPDADVRVQKLADQIQALTAIQATLDRANLLLAERRQALITAAVKGQLDVTTARGADVA